MAYEDDEEPDETEEPVEPTPEPTPEPEPTPAPPPEPEPTPEPRASAAPSGKETWEPWTPPAPPEEPKEADYGFSDLGVPVGARTAAPAPPKETWEPWTEPEGPAATVGRSLAHQVIPTAAAIGAGVLTSPAGPWVAIPAAIGAYAATEYGQGKVLDKTGYGDEAQMEANRRANPKAAMLGDFGGAAIPWGVGKKAELAQRAIGAGIGGVIEGGSQAMRGEFDPTRLGAAVGTGAVFNTPRAGTAYVEKQIAQGASRVTGRPDLYAPYTGYTPPPQPYIVPEPPPPDQGRFAFDRGTPQAPMPYDVRTGEAPLSVAEIRRKDDLALRWEKLTPKERTEYDTLNERDPSAGAKASTPRPQIGGGESQPGLPFDQAAPEPMTAVDWARQRELAQQGTNLTPAERTEYTALEDKARAAAEAGPAPRAGPSVQPELGFNPPVHAPPTEGQLGFNITTPEGSNRPGMPPTAGVAREAAPPAAGNQPGNYPRYAKWPEAPNIPEGRRGEPSPKPHSLVEQGMLSDVPPQQARGINVLQPGQGDPTIRHALGAPPASAPKPAPRPPAPEIERGTAGRLPDWQGPPAPIPRNQQLVPRPPDSTQGMTEARPQPGMVRLYATDPRSPRAFTTDRNVARQFGPLRHVDVSHGQLAGQFQPSMKDPKGFIGHGIWATKEWQRKVRPTLQLPTQPTQRQWPGQRPPPPPPAPPAAPPPPPARGGPRADPALENARDFQRIVKDVADNWPANQMQGKANLFPDEIALLRKAGFDVGNDGSMAKSTLNRMKEQAERVRKGLPQPPPARGGPPAPGKPPAGTRMASRELDEQINQAVGRAVAPERPPAAPAGGGAPLDFQTANRILNQPRALNTEAAKRGMTPEALKAQAKTVRPPEPAAAPPAPPAAQPAVPPIDMSVAAARARAGEASRREEAPPQAGPPPLNASWAEELLGNPKELKKSAAIRGMTPEALEAQAREVVGRGKPAAEAPSEAVQKQHSDNMEGSIDRIERAIEAGDRAGVLKQSAEARKALAAVPENVKAADPDYWAGFDKLIKKMAKPGYETATQQAAREGDANAQKIIDTGADETTKPHVPTEKPPASSKAAKGPHIDALQKEFNAVKKEYEKAKKLFNNTKITRHQYGKVIDRFNAAQDKLFDARYRGMHKPEAPAPAAVEPPAALAAKAVRARERKPIDPDHLSAVEFLASRGGISPDLKGDLMAALGEKNPYFKQFNTTLVNKKGMTPDKAREALVEAGYLNDEGAMSGGKSETDLNSLYKILSDELGPNPVRQMRLGAEDSPAVKKAKDAQIADENAAHAERIKEDEETVDAFLNNPDRDLPDVDQDVRNRMVELVNDGGAPEYAYDKAIKERDAQREFEGDIGKPRDLADIPDDVGKARPPDDPGPGKKGPSQMAMFGHDYKTAAQRGADSSIKGDVPQNLEMSEGLFGSSSKQAEMPGVKPKEEVLPPGTPEREEFLQAQKDWKAGKISEEEFIAIRDDVDMRGDMKTAGDKFSSELHKAEQAAEKAGKSRDDALDFLSPEGKAALKEHTELAEKVEERQFGRNYEKLNDMLPEGYTATREKHIRMYGDEKWMDLEGDRHDLSFDIRDKNGEMVGSISGVHLFDKDIKNGWFKELLDTGHADPVHEKAMKAAREANNVPEGVVDLGFEKARPGLQDVADRLAAAGKKVPGKVAPFKSVADDAAAKISEQNAKAKAAEVNRLQQKYFDAQKQLDSLEKDVKRGVLEDTDPKYLNARRAAEDAINAWHEAEGISIKKPSLIDKLKDLGKDEKGGGRIPSNKEIGAAIKRFFADERGGGPKKGPVRPVVVTHMGTEFRGATVDEAAKFAKAAGFKSHQIFTTNGQVYSPPAPNPRAVAGNNNPPSATAAGGGAGKPPGKPPPPTGGTPPGPTPPPRKGRTADEEAILGRIANPESWTDKIPRTKEEANKAWRAYYTAAKNALDPIEQLTKLAGKAPKNPDKVQQFMQDIGWSPKARAVDFDKDPGVLARLTKGLGGRFQSQIGIRNPFTGKVTGGTYDINTGQRTGDPLEKVLTQVKQDPEGFAAYIIARRALDLHAQGKQTGMDIKAANGVVTAGGARWGPVSKELSAFKDRVLDNLTDVMGAKAVAAIKANNPNHVPFYRAIPPESELGKMLGAGLTTTKPIHEFKGSNEKIYHPLDTIPKNVMAFTDIAERNRVGRALEDLNNSLLADRKFMAEVRDSHPIKVSPEEVNRLLKKEGIPEEVIDGMTIFRPDFFKPTDTRIRVYRDGKAKVYEVSPEVGKAWNAMDQQALHPIVKALSIPARTLRAGAVTNLEFLLRNLTRDQFTAMIQSPHGYIPYWDFGKALGNIFVGSEKYHHWLRNGGANANLVSVDRRIINVDPKTLGEKFKNVVVSPFHALQLMSELAENATRLGVAMRAVKKGATWTEGTFHSREATLDFQRVGSNMRAVNNLVTFFNSRYEGIDRLARAFRDQPARALFMATASITVPSLMLWYNNKDDPRVQEIERWEKDIFWIIPTTDWKTITPAVKDYADGLSSAWKRTLPNGTEQYNAGKIYRWPKPFAEGTFFGSIPERVMEAYHKHDSKAFDDLTKVVRKALNLEVSTITPQVAVPFIEQFANESLFFERPLMSQKLAKGSPEKQENYNTSETAKYIGAAIRAAAGEKATGGSPIIVDNYIRAWTGGLGQYVVKGISDNIIKAGEKAVTGKERPPSPEWAASDFTGVKAFVARWPRSQTESIRQFYKEREERLMDKTDYDAMKKSDPDAADARAVQGGLYTGNSAAKTIGAARKLVDEINSDKSMSPADKRMAIDLTWLTMIETAKEGLATFKEDRRDRNAK